MFCTVFHHKQQNKNQRECFMYIKGEVGYEGRTVPEEHLYEQFVRNVVHSLRWVTCIQERRDNPSYLIEDCHEQIIRGRKW